MSPDTSTTVIKIGGARLREEADLAALAELVQQRRAKSERLVVVHGGGAEIGELHRALDLPFEKRLGLRVTSDASMPLVTMVLAGLVNTRLVARLLEAGVPALGLSGVDGGLLRSRFIDHATLGRVGGPPRVDASLLQRLLDTDQVLVVAPVCLGPDGAPVNVNADTAAHALATALRARSLDFISDVPGVLTSDGEVAPRLSSAEVQALLHGAAITGGMIPKLQAALAALDAGVQQVRVGDLQGMQCRTATEIHIR